MGVVYEAHDAVIDRKVAIKLVRTELLEGKERQDYVERFQREAQAVGRCNHPCIVAIFDYALHEENPFLVMEYVDGVGLDTAMSQGERFAPNAAVHVILQVLDALACAHAAGIVHRDIKPGNILLVTGGGVKVTDFGVARLDTSNLTLDGMAIGTPRYMSPEQCCGGPVDQRSDLFSAAIVLQEMLTGERPFPGRNLTEIACRLLRDPPAGGDEVKAVAGPAVSAVIQRALEKAPEDRYASASVMADALREAIGQAVPQSSPAATIDKTVIAVRAQSASPQSSGGSAFDPVLLSNIERRLANRLGPIARYLVQTLLPTATSAEALCDVLAQRIDRPDDRRQFLSEALEAVRSGATGSPSLASKQSQSSSPSASPSPSPPGPSPHRRPRSRQTRSSVPGVHSPRHWDRSPRYWCSGRWRRREAGRSSGICLQPGSGPQSSAPPSSPDATRARSMPEEGRTVDVDPAQLPQIAGYTTEAVLGAGGMATVYLAVQDSLSRHVALKVMSQILMADADFCRRFLNEGRLIAKLSHPNIVTVYDIGASDRFHYLSMTYLAGGTLKEKIRDGLPLEYALYIVKCLADALGYAHGQGIVHRDIKPGNVLFTHSGAPVLTDFGIAKTIGNETKLTSTGVTVGSVGYMSPEQALGDEVDNRSDLYSLGVLFWQMLTGTLPYSAPDPFALALKHANDPIPELPERLDRFQPVIEGLMAKKPEDRMASAEELLRVIDAHPARRHRCVLPVRLRRRPSSCRESQKRRRIAGLPRPKWSPSGIGARDAALGWRSP